ncbi:MAG TPA: nuclear transport factor 2 family protein [Euzebyales bacterium]
MARSEATGTDRDAVERWIAAYETLWRTAGTDRLPELFTPDAAYVPSPWHEPIADADAIARFWDEERDGPNEVFTMASDVIAVDGDVAVVRVAVDYAHGRSWRDLWVLRFAGDGRVSRFEEWPFAPDTFDGH